MLTLGMKLKKLRSEKGVSQATAADEIGIAKATLSNYEKNNREPNIEMLNKIARYYKVEPNDLIKPDLVPNYRTYDLKRFFDSEDIEVDGRRLTYRQKDMIYEIAKVIVNRN